MRINRKKLDEQTIDWTKERDSVGYWVAAKIFEINNCPLTQYPSISSITTQNQNLEAYRPTVGLAYHITVQGMVYWNIEQ